MPETCLITPPPSNLDVRLDGHVARVWINRPERRNAFDDTIIAELTQVFTALASRQDLRVVVLGGHGEAFCAGADLHWMRKMAGYSWAENHADALRLAEMLWAIAHCPVPVIARVQGDCHGGGVGLVAACDIAVAADTVGMSLSEVRLGLTPATISPYVLRAIGERAMRRYALTAERIGAQEARALGLLHEVCPPGELDTRVQSLVDALVANGPQAVRVTKRLIGEVRPAELNAELRDHTARCIADVRASEEGRAGVQAFLNRTKAPWRS